MEGKHLVVLCKISFGNRTVATHAVTPGLSRDRGVGGSKVIRLLSIIHNGIILDLVCGFGGSAGGDVRAGFSSVFREKTSFFLWWRP